MGVFEGRLPILTQPPRLATSTNSSDARRADTLITCRILHIGSFVDAQHAPRRPYLHGVRTTTCTAY